MTAEVTASVEKALTAFEALKSEIMPLKGKLDAFDAAKYDKIQESISAAMEAQQKAEARAAAIEEKSRKIEEQNEALAKEYKLIEAAVNRPVMASTPESKAQAIREKANKLFNAFARVQTATREVDLGEFARDYAKERADDLELKALTVNSDPSGGYLVMPEFGGIIQTYVYETSPMRQYANVTEIGTDSLEYVTDNDQTGYTWVGETQARLDTYTPQLGLQRIVVNEIEAMPNVSQKMIDDATVDIEAWVAGKVAEAFARAENSAFIAGNGVNKPLGILSYPAGASVGTGQVQQVYSGSASGFTYGGLIALQNSLKEPYQNNAVFFTQRASMASLLNIMDGQNRPIFNMMYDKNGGLESSILGRPVVFASDMPTIASNAVIMAYGDFRRAYQIVDRTGIRVIRDIYTNKPFIRFYTTKRVGGGVVNFEAYKLLVAHT